MDVKGQGGVAVVFYSITPKKGETVKLLEAA